MKLLKSYLVFFIAVVLLLSLNSCSSEEAKPDDKLNKVINNRLDDSPNERFFVVLKDMGSDGPEDFWHNYELHILPENEEPIKVEETGKVKVNGMTFQNRIEDLGMEIASVEKGQVNKQVGPIGFSMLVGDDRYGEWRSAENDSTSVETQAFASADSTNNTTSSSSSNRTYRSRGSSGLFWFFLGRSTSRYGGYYGNNGVPQNQYNQYRANRGSGVGYYGTQPDGSRTYGTRSNKVKNSSSYGKNWNNLSNTQRRVNRIRSQNRSKVLRNSGRSSSSSIKSRSGGFGK